MRSRSSAVRRTALCAGALAACAGLSLHAQEAPDSEAPTFGAATSAVLVDVVVRDDRGRVVRDLTAEDFAIYEEGVRQEILSFEVVSRDAPTRTLDPEPAPEAERPAAPPAEPGPPPALVALVFDRLTPSARSLAKQAAHAYVERAAETGDLIGVYSVGLSLRTMQAPTDDPEALRAAIDSAVDASTEVHESARARIRALNEQLEGMDTPDPGAGGGSGAEAGAAAAAAATAAGLVDSAAALLQMELRMLRTQEAIERDQQGYATMNGLLAVVNALRLHPGRKTAVVFSEGLSVPANVEPKFRALIDAANRGNVAIYTMDAAGLRAESTTTETRREMMAAAQAQMAQRGSGRDDFRGAMTQELERNEDRLRLDPHTGMSQLARETGGFLVRDTNDLAAAARRVEEEIRFHYLLSYSPTDSQYDGRFRNIDVEVSRPDVRVRARNGYFALRADDPWPVQPYEAPAMAMLTQQPQPNALPVRSGGICVPQPERPGLVPVLVEVPAQALRFEVDEETDEYRGDFVILARVRDASGAVVERVSQHYLLSGPAGDEERARQGEVLFYRELDLEPGRYALEAIVHDRLADAAGVSHARLEVGAADALRMSSLVLVKRVEPAPEGEEKHPLQFGQSLLYPNLGEPIHKSDQTQLAFFVGALLSGPAAPKATLEVFQNQQNMGRVPLEIPPPPADGHLEHLAAIPIGAFPVGDYELKITLDAEGVQASRVAAFSVRE